MPAVSGLRSSTRRVRRRGSTVSPIPQRPSTVAVLGEDRPAVGEAANRTKAAIEGAVATRLTAIDHASLAADLSRSVDVHAVMGRDYPAP